MKNILELAKTWDTETLRETVSSYKARVKSYKRERHDPKFTKQLSNTLIALQAELKTR